VDRQVLTADESRKSLPSGLSSRFSDTTRVMNHGMEIHSFLHKILEEEMLVIRTSTLSSNPRSSYPVRASGE
jgi:hypothetical protein